MVDTTLENQTKSSLSVWNKGNFEAPSGGEDNIFPTHYGAILPRRAEYRRLISVSRPKESRSAL